MPDGRFGLAPFLAPVDRATIPASVTSIGDNVFSAHVTVVTPPGSYAESYAKAHGLTVKHPS